ncbi:MAG: hypothetical protein L0387_42365 [Acidobacteria bacterium]|nr:hypothetical protein [Acidobacteriota bacterium]
MDTQIAYALNVFADDKNGTPIPGVEIVASYKGQEIVRGKTLGIPNTPIRLQFPRAYDHLTLQARYRDFVKHATVDGNAGNFAFRFEEVEVNGKRENNKPHTVTWVFGGILIIFFMALVWFKPEDAFGPDQSRIIRLLAALAVGLISAFFVGGLKLGGKVPLLPNVVIAAFGGFAGFVLTLLLW